MSQALSTRYPPGSVLAARYEIVRPIGWGGMAEVYLAADRELGREVAVKVILQRYAEDDRVAARFRREARAAAALNHPNVVSIHDVGSHQGSPFIVMEYVAGRTLAEVVQTDGALPPDRVADIGEAVARALGAAHAVGIVHRDVKPGNVMVTGDGRVKVLDFGIARALQWTPLTESTAVHGTAEYMAPEYVRGEGADPRSDLYSLGAVLYELLVGRPPFTGDSPLQVAYRHLEEAPAAPDSINREIPPGLSAVIVRCLAKHPGDRYRRAEELAADLHRMRSGLPAATAPVPGPRTGVLHRPPAAEPAPPRRRRARWAIAGVVVATLAVVGLLLPSLWPDPAPADRRAATPRPVRPPAEVSAAGRCGGFLAAEVVVRWEPSPSRFADGYDLYRSSESGGQYERIAFVPGRDTTSFTDGAVGLGDTYYYLIRAKAGQRESRPTQVQADTPSVCFF